jgi:hypothetical protein
MVFKRGKCEKQWSFSGETAKSNGLLEEKLQKTQNESLALPLNCS